MLLRIKAPHFVAGVVLEEKNGVYVAVKLAPIIRYMHGWSREKIESYCSYKDWEAEDGGVDEQN